MSLLALGWGIPWLYSQGPHEWSHIAKDQFTRGPKPQVPLVLAIPNMEAKSQLLNLKLSLKCGEISLEVGYWLIYAKIFARLGLRVGFSFVLDPTRNTSPKPHLQKAPRCRQPCHSWDFGLGTMCEVVSPNFHALNGRDCMDWPNVTWDLGPLHTREWEPVTSTLQALSLVEKAEPVQVCFTPRLRDQRRMWMHDGCQVHMDSYMASKGSCFHGHLDYFQTPPLKGRLDHKPRRPLHSECSQPLIHSIVSCARTRMNSNALK